MQRAIAEMTLLGARRRRARLLGRPLRALLRGRVARPLDLPGAGARRDRRRAAAARGGAGDRPRGAGDRRSPRGCPGSSRDVGVAVVVTTMFGARGPAGALAGLAAGDRDAALRRHPRPHRRRPDRRRRRSSRVRRGRRSRCLHGRLLATGFDRGRRRGRSASRRRSSTRRCWSCSRRRSWSPSRASATCSSSPSSSARPRAPATSPTGSVPMIASRGGDRGARRPRRPLPLLLRGNRRRRLGGAGDRRRLPALAAARPGCAAAVPDAALRRGLRSSEMASATDTRWAEHALETLQAAGHRRGGARTAVVEALAAPRLRRHRPRPRRRAAPAPSRRSAAPASTGRSSSSSSSAWCSGSRSAAAPPATSGSTRPATTTTTRSAATAAAWSPSRTPRSSRRSGELSERMNFEVTEHDVVLRGRCEDCSTLGSREPQLYASHFSR